MQVFTPGMLARGPRSTVSWAVRADQFLLEMNLVAERERLLGFRPHPEML